VWRCAEFCRNRLVLRKCVRNRHVSRAFKRMRAPGKNAATRTGRTVSRFLGAAFWLALAAMAMGVRGNALEPATAVANFGRQTWVMENGLPQNTIQAMVHTRDGFVWLGTEVGLVRFDGSSFAVFDRNSNPALPSNDVRCLLETPDGSLWIGTSDGLARWKNRIVTHYSTVNGLPGNGIRSMSLDASGALLLITDAGMARQSGDRFQVYGDWPAGSVIAETTAQGEIEFTRYVPQFAGVPAGEGSDPWRQAALRAGIPKESLAFRALLKSGEIAVGSKGILALERDGKLLSRLTVGKDLPGSRIQLLLADREGSLWVGTNSGLARLVEGKLQRLPVTDPLASVSVLSLMEDPEGNLWVGTESDGLHILRDQRFRTVGAREGLSNEATTAVVEDGAGALWVGTSGGGLNALRGSGRGTIKSYSVRDGLLSDVILSLAAAPNGDLWVGTPDGLNRIRKGHIDAYTSSDGLADDFIRSLLADGDGSLWIGTRRGLTHWSDPASGPNGTGGHMETFTQANGLGSDLVGALAHDSAGDLWVATLAGLSRLRMGRITNFTVADGLSSNVVTALLPRANGALLIGTQDHGWSQWNGSHFTATSSGGKAQGQALAQTSIHAILDDGLGHLWFATGNGIARCDCSASRGGMASADCSHWIEFGAGDGLRSRETATNSHPSAWRSHDGHLWFATPKGLVEVDPAHFPVNTAPPPVALERFTVDDVPMLLGGPWLRIEAGHVHFEFDYAGLSFVAPQKVRYRFMLEGFDKGWTEAGTRRTAYYTAIPPGKYTFRVQAANNDGLWNAAGSALYFELRPHFYQTFWFYGLLLALAGGLVAWLLQLRLQRAEGEFKAVLGERGRIAREIHDTLAQGYVGISVQLEVLAELLRQNRTEAAAKHLDLTRGHVREGLADARQSIWALRSQDADETTLPVKIRRLVETEDGHGIEAKFSIFGAYRPLPPGTEREIQRVAQEAIHNVRKHAGARHLSVQLEYGSAQIALEVRDDCRGFAADGEPESSAGHYGLTGMRERAVNIGGRLEVTSELGSGTVVRLKAAAPRESREKTGE